MGARNVCFERFFGRSVESRYLDGLVLKSVHTITKFTKLQPEIAREIASI